MAGAVKSSVLLTIALFAASAWAMPELSREVTRTLGSGSPQFTRTTKVSRPRRPSYNNDKDDDDSVVIGGSDTYYPGYSDDNEKVAFTVQRADRNSRRAVTNIGFEQVVSDIGYGWNSRSDAFETYYPGLYVFAFTALSTENSQFRVSLTLNGRETGHAWGNYAGYQSAGATVALQLRRGDVVRLRLTEGQLHEPSSTSRGYTTFTGFKL